MSDELSKILAACKAQAAAGTARIAFDPMALAYALEHGIAAAVAAERERCAKLSETWMEALSVNLARRQQDGCTRWRSTCVACGLTWSSAAARWAF